MSKLDVFVAALCMLACNCKIDVAMREILLCDMYIMGMRDDAVQERLLFEADINFGACHKER